MVACDMTVWNGRGEAAWVASVVNMSISLSIPGDTAHLGVLRATAAAVAARARLTIDQLEDVRLAVEEAANSLLSGNSPLITMTMDPGDVPLTVTVTASPANDVDLSPEGFTWTVLSAMTDDLTVNNDGNAVTLTMRFAVMTAAQ